MAGLLDSRFTPVGEAFQDGFEAGRDVGAAVAAFVDGKPVVDLWHGHADRRRRHPWHENTLVCMFSVTKAMTTVCLLQAVDRRLLELDAPLAEHWPEFAANGKEQVTLRHVLCHQAGLVGFHEPVDAEILYDWPRYIAALEHDHPWWEPGTRHGYHARTFGFLLGELLRRVSGLSLGEWFRREVAGPGELDFAIGVPEADLDRCAEVLPARIRAGQGFPPAASDMMKDFNDPSTPTGAAFQNPAMPPGYLNSEAFRRAEIPAANGHGTARAAAAMFDRLGSLVSPETLQLATTSHSLGPDEVLRSHTHFGLGFMLHNDQDPGGLRPGSFGHAGAGGSIALHDPQAKLSFCFAMNQLEAGVVSAGTSAARVLRAVYDCM